MRARPSPSTSSRTAALASLPLTICAPPKAFARRALAPKILGALTTDVLAELAFGLGSRHRSPVRGTFLLRRRFSLPRPNEMIVRLEPERRNPATNGSGDPDENASDRRRHADVSRYGSFNCLRARRYLH